MPYKVKHKSFGEGFVQGINGNVIEIQFGTQRKKFQFPQAFGSFLVTDDCELNEKVRRAKALLHDTYKNKKYLSTTGPATKNSNNYMNSFVGNHSQTILVSSEQEMFELVGYMARPGRIKSIEAEIPKDGRDKLFENAFPGQKYRPIEMGNTPSGLPNKLSPQFRINFADLHNCPESLRINMGKGNGGCVGRINKSRFVFDLVQRYGFRFGDEQNLSKIKAIAQDSGYIEAFEKGFKR